MGVFEGAEDAGGHLFDGLVEEGVDAGDDDVHLGEGGVVEVEGAVGEDVDFDAGEDADVALPFRRRLRGCALMWARARLSSRPLVMARFLVWSVMAM